MALCLITSSASTMPLTGNPHYPRTKHRVQGTVIRVLHLCEGVGPKHGGPGIDLPNYCHALAGDGCEVVLAVGYSSDADHPARMVPAATVREDARGYSLLTFPCILAHRWRFSPSLVRWLAHNIAGFDIVHLHSLYSFPILSGATLARWRRIPYVLTTHAVLAPFQRRVSRVKKAAYGALFARRILNDAAAVIYSARTEYDEALPLGIRAPAVIIPNGIALDQFSRLPGRGWFRSRYLQGAEGPLLLYLGRLNAKKGLDLLLPAFAQVLKRRREAWLALVGAGDPPAYANWISRRISELGIGNRVVMTGMLAGEQKLSAYADADLFVLPSRSENFATAMFEAMACRLPVIVSSGVNLWQEVQSSGAGLVVGFEPDQLSAVISKLLDDPRGMGEMGGKARALAENYTSKRTAAHLAGLYRRIITGEPAGNWAMPKFAGED